MARTTQVVKEGDQLLVVVTTTNEDGSDTRMQKQPVTEAAVLGQMLGLAQQRESLVKQLKATEEERIFWEDVLEQVKAAAL
jgi:hypothetical protein